MTGVQRFLVWLFLVSIVGVRMAHAQSCTVSVSTSGPDANGILTYQFNAQADTSCRNNVVGSVKIWLDVQDDAHRVSTASSDCSYKTPCSGSDTLDTYCWAPLTPHKLIASCYPTCGLPPPPVNPAATFTTGTPTPPSLSLGYVPNQGLTRTYSFTPYHLGPISIYIDGVYDSNDSRTPYYTSGTITGQPTVDVCTGDHTFTVYAQACDGSAPWTTRKDLTVPDPGDPTVSIWFEPSGNSYIGKVHYSFPSAGTRVLKVVRKAKPPYTTTDTDIVPSYSPLDLSSTIQFTPDSTSGDEIYEAIATSGNCNPAHEKKADAALDNTKCCPGKLPNGGRSGLPPGGITATGSVGNPVRLTTGNMHYTDSEPLPQPLVSLTRTYDSANAAVGAFGKGWTSLFDAGAVVTGTGNDQSIVINTEENKRYVWFIKNGAYIQTWPTDTATPAAIGGSAGSGFTLRESGADLVRSFSSSGRLIQLTSLRQQRSLSISYDGNGHPTQVADSWGDVTLLVTTDPASGLITRIDVSGRPDIFWTYQYSSNLLVGVLAPDSQQWRQYQYSAGLLSTILDPLGNLIESHSYDGSGRATSSIQSTNDVTSVQYGLAGRNSTETLTTVTYASGKVSNYYSRTAGSSVQTADVFGGCSACSSENGTYVYDNVGHITRSQDARGYVTDAVYAGGVLSTMHGPLKPSTCDPQTDSNHCRLTVEDLAAASVVATPLTLTTNYVYGDSHWPDRPTSITIDSVANPGGTRQETLTYDATTGQVLTQTETGWTSATQSETHTTTTTLYGGSEGAAFTPGGPFNSSWLTLAQPVGLRKQVDGPRTDVTDVTKFVYYPIDSSVTATWRGRLAAVQDALGHITTYADYDVFGNAQTVIDANGVIVNTTYDPLGRLLTTKYPAIAGCDTTADPTCSTDIIASRSYSPGGGPLATETKPRGGVTSYTYDTRGRVASITRTISATVSERIEYNYDPNTGQKSAERYLDNSSGSFVAKKSVAYSYDAEGRLSQVLYPDSAKSLYAYDVAGALATVQDENHASANTFYTYDAKGALATVSQTLGASQISTTYAYDAQGNLTSVTDPNGNVTTYTYDDFGRMAKQVSPVTGTTTYGYDLAGNLVTTTDANGATTTRTYDALSRVTVAASSRSGSPTETIGWTYDNAAAGAFGVGRLAGTTYPAGSTTYLYDRRGLLRNEQATLGGAVYTSTYTYDSDANRDSLGYPGGGVARYTYDLAGRPSSMQSIITSAQYLPFGPLTALSFTNGTTKTMSYDFRYRITENKLTGPSGTIADYTYTEDPAGNITAIHDATDPTYNRDFTYDDLNRLVTANSGSSLWGTGSYAYDAMGNLTSRSLGTAPVDDGTVLSIPGRHLRASASVTGVVDKLAFTYNSTTPEIGVATWNGIDHNVGYDAAGNETSYFASRTYSPRNLLATVTDNSGEGTPHTISYGYDARGVRVTRSESPTSSGTSNRYFTYTPELQLISITDDDSSNLWASGHASILSNPIAPSREFGYFNGMPVSEFGPPRTPDSTVTLTLPRHAPAALATTLYYTFTDHLGTPLLQTDSSGNVAWRAEHEPYGSVWKMRTGSRTDQPLRLPGQDLAMTWEGTEENYNVFRWFRAEWGRYTQADPIGLSAGINLYRYGYSNPNTYTDPTGLFVDPSKALEDLMKQMLNECKILTGGPKPLPIFGTAVAVFLNATPAGQGSTLLPIPYPKCAKKCQENNCPPCNPPVGTIGYNYHKVPPHDPHPGISGDHVHYFQMQQIPSNCDCFWKNVHIATAPPPAPYAVPLPTSDPWP